MRRKQISGHLGQSSVDTGASNWTSYPYEPFIHHRVLILLAPCCLGFLLLAGLPVLSSATLVVILGLQWAIGSTVHRLFIRVLPRTELDPVSLALGALAFSIVSSLARIGVGRSVRELTVMLVLIPLLMVGACRRPKDRPFRRSTSELIQLIRSDAQLALVVFLSALVMLSQTWLWIIPIIALVGLVVVLSFYWRNNHLRYASVVIAPIIVVTILRTLQTRSDFWWLPGWGIDEHKLFANAFWEWGPLADPLSAGIPARYQWLGYSIVGDLAKFSGMDLFQMVSRANPIIIAVTMGVTLIALAKELGLNRRHSMLAPLVAASATTILSDPVGYSILPINYFPQGVFTITVWLIQLIRWSKTKSLGNFGLLLILSIASIAVKSVHLVPVTIGVFALGLYGISRRKYLSTSFQLIATVVSIALYVHFFFPASDQSGLKLGSFFLYLQELAIFPQSLTKRVLIACVHLGLISTPIILALIYRIDTNFNRIRILLISTYIPGLLAAIFTNRTSGTQLHFLQVSLTLGIACLPIVTFEAIKRYCPYLRLSPSLVVRIVIALSVNSFLHFLGFQGRSIIGERLLVSFNALGFLLTGVLFFRCLPSNNKGSLQSRAVLAGIASLTSMLPVAWGVNDDRPIHKTGEISQLGDSELQQIGNVVDDLVDKDEIVSTDIFFNDGREICREVSIHGLRSAVDEVITTNYFTPAVVIERRFLVVAPRYGFYFSDVDPSSRILLSIQFGCSPSEHAASELRRLGVTWFLGRKASLIDEKLQLGDQIVFSNSRYVLVDLRANFPKPLATQLKHVFGT